MLRQDSSARALTMGSGTAQAKAPGPPALDQQQPANLKTATFAMGWFWGPDSRFGSLDGVVRTRVGYAGGKKPNPTYRSIGDHMETIQVDYDPRRISYQQLLAEFWKNHNPFSVPWSRQYASAIFYHDPEQKRLALASKAKLEARRRAKASTEIVPLERFYLAEDYHQKYQLRQSSRYIREFRRLYPKDPDRALLQSTVAARLNGYLGGQGSLKLLASELPRMGLTLDVSRRLWSLTRARRPQEQVVCPLPAQ